MIKKKERKKEKLPIHWPQNYSNLFLSVIMMYRVASASEYLVITGAGIPDIKLAKKAWVLPAQSCTVFDVSPINYNFEVQAMSAEKLPFILPAVFTIGPCLDDEESLLKYAKLISPHDKLSNHVHELVQGIIEGAFCLFYFPIKILKQD